MSFVVNFIHIQEEYGRARCGIVELRVGGERRGVCDAILGVLDGEINNLLEPGHNSCVVVSVKDIHG